MARLIDADALADWILFDLYDQHFDALTGRQAANLIGKAIDESPTVGEWVSVKDRLPEIGEHVLIFAKGYDIGFIGDYVATITYRHDLVRFGSLPEKERTDWCEPFQDFHDHYKVTHWMPLPEPPKEDEE